MAKSFVYLRCDAIQLCRHADVPTPNSQNKHPFPRVSYSDRAMNQDELSFRVYLQQTEEEKKERERVRGRDKWMEFYVKMFLIAVLYIESDDAATRNRFIIICLNSFFVHHVQHIRCRTTNAQFASRKYHRQTNFYSFICRWHRSPSCTDQLLSWFWPKDESMERVPHSLSSFG